LSLTTKRIASDVPRFGLIAHAIAWWLLLVLLAFVVPRAEEIFTDFAIPLPRATTLLFRASHLVCIVVPLILGVLGADHLVAKALRGRGDPELSRAWSALMFAFPLVLLAVTVVALVQPFLTSCWLRLSG